MALYIFCEIVPKTEPDMLSCLVHMQCIFRSRCACGGETMFKVVGNLQNRFYVYLYIDVKLGAP